MLWHPSAVVAINMVYVNLCLCLCFSCAITLVTVDDITVTNGQIKVIINRLPLQLMVRHIYIGHIHAFIRNKVFIKLISDTS